MAALRRDVAPILDRTWGWGEEDPQTGQDLYRIASEVRQPMPFEEDGWDKPEHRYTWEQVKAMQRNEFDHRLDLHSIYGFLDFDADHIRARRPDPQHPVRAVLRDTLRNNDIDWEDPTDVVEMAEAGYKPRYDLRRDHVERGLSPADANMGDTFTPEEQEEWVRRTAERQNHHRLDPLEAEDIYENFHMRQYERLLDLGKRRQAEANQFMSELKKREALRHAYDAKGRSADLLLGDSGTKPMDQDGSGTTRAEHMREMIGGAIGDTHRLQQRLTALRNQRAAYDQLIARRRQTRERRGYDDQKATDAYLSAASSSMRTRYVHPGRPLTGPGAMPSKRQRVMPAAPAADRNAARATMSQRAQATDQMSATIEDLMGRREHIQGMIDTLENRLDHTEQDAAQGLLDLSQSGSGVSGPPMGAMAQVMPVSTARLTRKPATGGPHVGASAMKVIAGTGLIAPAPGYHYMATGEYMKDPE
jgi:hypothetical protein